MKLYHTNPSTGVTGLCRAKAGGCPIASIDEHFSSESEARLAYETQQDNDFQKLQKINDTMLSSVLDVELLEKMIQERYINRNRHPDDNDLQILCYTVGAQVDGKWNDATKQARGLIVRGTTADDTVIVERPWEKFFTLSQMDNSWHLGDEENQSSAEDSFTKLDFKAPAEVYDKMDGSMGILYRSPKGLPVFATKGSFISDQAQMFTKLLQANEAYMKGAEDILNKKQTTAIFELVGPENRIVLSYEKNDVVLLGGVNKATGAHVAPEDLSGWKDLPTVERMQARTLEEALAIEPRSNREGVVVSIMGAAPMKIKIKQDDYVRLHRIVTMFSPKESRKLVADIDASMEDMVRLDSSKDVEYFPAIKEVLNIDGFKKGEDSYELIRSRREGYFNAMLLPRAKAIAEANEIVSKLDESWFTHPEPMKNFAQNVKTFDAESSTLFSLFKARLDGKPLSSISAASELKKAAKNVKDS